ncbi:MAG: tRNA (N(6)-L-threonylcarbamoyladenosine(37)-C(2))-methylthiotransferase MtaB [Thermodesulfobacteriota bacterium]
MMVSITTLGCKSNQYDSFAIEEILERNNFFIVNSPENADACIINTCTVTGKTDSRSRQLIRKVKRRNPGALVIVTGCYAQVSPREVAAIDGVDYVLGNPEKEKIVEYLTASKIQNDYKGKVDVGAQSNNLGLRTSMAPGRTRAYLKVQDGCDNSCSYCIIPRARGRARSLSLNNVLREIDKLIEKGYKEIVITGIHLGSYGLDLPSGLDIIKLIRLIEDRRYPCRFRVSSLDPDEVTDEFIDIMASAKTICKHLHLPLQSGDEGILKKMDRCSNSTLFRERIIRLVDSMPSLSIGVDIIVGFPGEGDAEFLNTYNMLKELPISYMHIFPFSKRIGTPAANFEGQIKDAVIKQRCKRLKDVNREKRMFFYSGFLGNEVHVLIESNINKATGLLQGRTDNYIPVLLDNYGGPTNKLLPVILKEITKDGVIGSVSVHNVINNK